MKISGVDVCPFCGTENSYEVEEGVWISKCEYCGRPLLLCDKCYSMTNGDRHGTCVKCPYDKKIKSLMKKWENEQIGKIVYWNDPDDDECSNYAKVIGFNDDVYVLAPIRCTIDGYKVDEGSCIEAYDEEIRLLSEDEQINVLIGHFQFGCGWGRKNKKK